MKLIEELRIFDERERNRAAGKEVPSFEAQYANVLPEESAGETKGELQIELFAVMNNGSV